ncbi:glycoside hydrolase family 6 protein [Astrocystis sublimbata]|nr:glycoside hydrolase family 6 protein [Astrocystis sublimbata]
MLSSLLLNFVLAISLHDEVVAATKCTLPATLDARGNVWRERALHPTSPYRLRVEQAVEAIDDEELRRRASQVSDFGTFMWITSPQDIRAIPVVADEVPCDEILGLVLDNLPYKGVQPNSPSHDYDPKTADDYSSLFIEPLATLIRAHPTVAFAVIIEPDAFPQYFNATTSSEPTQRDMNLIRSYSINIPVALNRLNLPNVIMYFDVGHSNSLDWARHRNETADAIIDAYNTAQKPAQLRGFATNVANWNSWDLNPGEFARSDDSRDIRPKNERDFQHILSSALKERGLPDSATHAIVDTSRNGVIGLRWSWDEWCNVAGAGLGARPSADMGGDVLDAFVWAKAPGESDGASTERGGDDIGCRAKTAVKPSPERGEWFQKFFEVLVRNARPEM